MQELVTAMAGFTPPALGQTTLSPGYAALLPVLAATWQHPTDDASADLAATLA